MEFNTPRALQIKPWAVWSPAFTRPGGGRRIDRVNAELPTFLLAETRGADTIRRSRMKTAFAALTFFACMTTAIHIGIGSDFDGFNGPPAGLEDVSKYPALLAELARRGYAKGEVKKVAGLNLLRAMRGAERVAAEMQRAAGGK